MNSDHTIIESNANTPRPIDGNATIIESQGSTCPPTTIEPREVPTASIPSTLNLVAGANFLEYNLLHPLKVASAEADLWLMERPADATKFILKLYRYGIHPKREILEAIQNLRREHIVDLLAIGEIDGRSYEIQEFISHGSLAHLLKDGALPENKVREALSEITDSLAHLHEVRVIHRDIKPSNVLVRGLQPLDLILTDFGISSLGDVSIHLTNVSRTAAYAAPEALTGVVARSSDWWSVGVIALEMLTGKHPLAGLSEQVINFQLVSKGIPIPQNINSSWLPLLQGLLTRDHEKRWGAEQIKCWLAGQKNIPLYFDQQTAVAPTGKPYKFDNQEFFTPRELAAALAQKWSEAVKHCAWGFINKWVETDVRDADLAVALKELSLEFQMSGDQRAAVVILLFNRELPFIFKSQVVDAHWCQQNADEALALAKSPLMKWLRRLKKVEPLQGWVRQREARQKELQEFGLALDQNIVARLLSSDPNSVISAASEQRTLFAGAREPKLQSILEKCELTFVEAIVLLACNRSLLLTAAQKSHWDRLAKLKSFGFEMDWHLAESLVMANSWETVQPMLEECRAHWRRRSRTKISLSHDRLKNVLENSTTDYLEAVATAANRLDFVNSLGMRFVTMPGLNVLFSAWATRVEDFTFFASETRLHWKRPSFPQTGKHPAVNVSWEEANAFCQWLTDKERKEERIGETDEYRLVYDLEWSHAVGLQDEGGTCPIQRAGKVKGIFPWGPQWPPPANTANVSVELRCESFTYTAPVGSFPANRYGIYDLGTNINEWVWDWYDPYQATKTIRGASWFQSTPESYWASARRFFAPNVRSDSLGFRCVLVVRTFTVPEWQPRLTPENSEDIPSAESTSTTNGHE